MRGTEVCDDAARSHFELWIRIRAFFTTIAFARINDLDFMTLGGAVHMSDIVLRTVRLTSNGSLAPVTYYVGAWTQTAKLMSEHVSTNDGPAPGVTLRIQPAGLGRCPPPCWSELAFSAWLLRFPAMMLKCTVPGISVPSSGRVAMPATYTS